MSDSRQALGFCEIARAAFDFLRTEYHFRLVTAEHTFLRYESGAVFVNVYHGRLSYELRFEIGLLRAPESKYTPEEFAVLYNVPGSVYFQASTPDRVRRFTPELADLLRRHGGMLLAGNAAEFGRLQEVSRRLSASTTRGYFLGDMRRKADKAWKQRDYPALVEALTAIGSDRRPSEERKLEYALQQLERSDHRPS